MKKSILFLVLILIFTKGFTQQIAHALTAKHTPKEYVEASNTKFLSEMQEEKIKTSQKEILISEKANTNVGKIMMATANLASARSSLVTDYHILAWNTETGKSKLYFLDYSTYTLKLSKIQLPTNPLPGATGKVMMSISGLYSKFYYETSPYVKGIAIYHILVWDTQTGKSKLYYFDTNDKKIETVIYQLPTNPLAGTSGQFMMSGLGFTMEYQEKPIYHILVWDTKTGKSKLYFLNTRAKKMVQAGYQLPISPLPEITGDVMMQTRGYFSGKTMKFYYRILVWDTKTAKSRIYYFNRKKNNLAESVYKVPSNPIPEASDKIMMSRGAFSIYNTRHENNDDDVHQALVWDNTGKSKQYYVDKESKKTYKASYQLPDNPLPEATGEIMMAENGFQNIHYKIVYFVLVWDTDTGKSELYFFSSSTQSMRNPGYRLPANPLADS